MTHTGAGCSSACALLPLFSTGLPQPASLAGDSDAGRGNRFSAMHQRLPEVQQSGASTRTRRLPHHAGPVEVRPEVAGSIHSVHLGQGTEACWLSASPLLLAGGVL